MRAVPHPKPCLCQNRVGHLERPVQTSTGRMWLEPKGDYDVCTSRRQKEQESRHASKLEQTGSWENGVYVPNSVSSQIVHIIHECLSCVTLARGKRVLRSRGAG